ncbi:MAG TPA: hypothetical protein VJ011_09775 [Steroidobacteraceae bacterium]|nr:hypothetical protein [Steroidobacteraceae bacterium]
MPANPAPPISITSRLGAEHRAALEQLLFFNSQQEALRERIAEVIERYGAPEIMVREGQLRIVLHGAPDAQALYAVLPQGRPVACALFVRSQVDRFVVLHLGVEPAWSGRGPNAGAHVILNLLRAIREAARRTRGVRRVELLYGTGAVGTLRISRGLKTSRGAVAVGRAGER